jgi:hypothetical protein
MPRSEKRRDPLPEGFQTLKEAAEFWDTHDLADYWHLTKGVKARVKVTRTPRYVPLDREIADLLVKVAKTRHISVETLVNLWLKERISEKQVSQISGA